MISTLSVIPIVAASIAGIIGIYFIFISVQGGNKKPQLAFGLSALAVAAYAVGTSGLYNATNLMQGTMWQRIQVSAMVFFTTSYFFFLLHHTNAEGRKQKQIALFTLTVLAIASQLLVKTPLVWNTNESILRFFIFLGQPYVVYESAPGPITIATYILGGFIYLHIFMMIINAYKRFSWSKTHPILLATTVIFAAMVNDMLVSAGAYHFLYVLDVSFLFVIVYISFLLAKTLLDAAANKEALLQANLELETHRKELENLVAERTQAYQYQAEYFQSLVNNSPIAIVTLDNEQRVTGCNFAFEQLFGYPLDEALYQDLDALIASDQVLQEAQDITRKVLQGERIFASGQRKRKDNQMVSVDILGVPVFVNEKKVGVLGLYQDITDRLTAERSLRESEVRYRSLFEDSPISLWEEDFSHVKTLIDGIKQKGVRDIRSYFLENLDVVENLMQAIRIINTNQASVQLYKAKSKEDLYCGLSERIPKESFTSLAEEFAALADGQRTFVKENTHLNFAGETLHVVLHLSIAPGYEDSWEKVFVSVIDITERKNNESYLQYLSSHDQLTGLANRTLLFDRLRHALAHARRKQDHLAVFFIDLDGFKSINDQYGHRIGDFLLIEAAKRLRECLRESDTVARVGGDEFVLLLENLENTGDIHSIAQKVLSKIAAPYLLEENTCLITTSIGISLFPQDGNDPEQLISSADTAMYFSKQRGKNQYSCYSEPASKPLSTGV